MVEFYEPPQADLEDRFGPLRGQISYGILEQLRRTKPWVQIAAVLGMFFSTVYFIFGGIAFLFLSRSSEFAELSPELAVMPGFAGGFFTGTGIAMILFGILGLFMCAKLWGYGSAIKRAVKGSDAAEVEAALNNQRVFWKIAGIISLILILLIVLLFGLSIYTSLAI